jgi:4-diphosphocytidyl-2-C-methyl-D-erythritol kinase
MDRLLAGPTLRVDAPAKLNLFLEVLGKRGDGFHEIETLMTAISIYDTLHFEVTQEDSIRLTCKWASGMEAYRALHGTDVVSPWGDLPSVQGNIVWKAVECFRRAAGIAAGAHIRLTKRIPSAAGLGGASSDAAAVLLAANQAWKAGWSQVRLGELAAELGSDVPFFLQQAAGGGPLTLCRGRGEQLSEVPAAARLHLVVVRPPVGLATADVYGRCRPPARPVGVQPLLEALREGRLPQLGRLLFNRLEAAAAELSPGLALLRRRIEQLDLIGCGMSGSGSSFFGICRHHSQARRVAALLRAARLGHVVAATTTPWKCQFAADPA